MAPTDEKKTGEKGQKIGGRQQKCSCAEVKKRVFQGSSGGRGSVVSTINGEKQ